MGIMKSNEAKLEKKLKKWGAKLEDLAMETGREGTQIKAESKEEFQKRIAELRFKLDAANKKLAEYKALGGGKWKNFKNDTETLWKDIEVTFKGLTQ